MSLPLRVVGRGAKVTGATAKVAATSTGMVVGTTAKTSLLVLTTAFKLAKMSALVSEPPQTVRYAERAFLPLCNLIPAKWRYTRWVVTPPLVFGTRHSLWLSSRAGGVNRF